jgi:hypothetical protein
MIRSSYADTVINSFEQPPNNAEFAGNLPRWDASSSHSSSGLEIGSHAALFQNGSHFTSTFADLKQPGRLVPQNGNLRLKVQNAVRNCKTRKDSPQVPRDVGLVEWRLNPKTVNAESTIRDAAFDSDLRNVFDPKG